MSPADDILSTPLQFLKGVGPRRAADLARIGLHTLDDLLCRFPIRYEDRGHVTLIAALVPGLAATVAGRVVSTGLKTTRRPGFKIVEVLIADASGPLRVVFFNQPFLRDVFVVGQPVIVHGPVEGRGTGELQLTNPQFEMLDEGDGETIHSGRIVPIYERAGSVTTKMQRRLVFDALELLPADLPDALPEELRMRFAWPARAAALRAAHFPPADARVDECNRFEAAAQRRLIFEEAFVFHVGLLARRRAAIADGKPGRIVVDDRIRGAARRVLPFPLTPGQKQALREIVEDLQRPHAMNRLLQGDVGSGKTIVALLTALVAMENGLQVAFMAPTEILAEQHALTLARMLSSTRFRVALLTSALSGAARRQLIADVETGAVHLVVGTQALVQGDVCFHRLGLAVIDEQHRFGVLQRATLRAKGLQPDVLVMTATPIPRTLALTAYGDLDTSVIPDMPPGRQPVKTLSKPESRRDEVYAFTRTQVEGGRQAYVVFPLVDESEKIDLRAATAMADELARDVFPQFRVGLLHGRMKSEEKDRVMKAFAAGEVHVLVATTVVEVGVDVPNASAMIIEHAERFGLAQLHQLRGRVGRGRHQSFCFLLHQSPLSEDARQRLCAMTETTDGFAIAERDLRLRGPGDFFGTRQSGVPTFRLVDVLRDQELLGAAHREAATWFDRSGTAHAAVAQVLAHWEQRFHLMQVG